MATRPPAPPVVLPALTKETAVVVFLHHTGANGLNWSKRFETMRLPHVRYVCPNAPARSLTVWDNAQTTAWYDVHGYSTSSPVDEASLYEANAKLHQLLDDIVASGVPSNRILVGGYSLGGCLALYGTLTYNKPLAASVVINCWLADYRPGSDKKFQLANKHTPIFQMHGDSDPFIALKHAKMTYDLCKTFNTNYTYKVFKNTQHWPTPEMFEAMKTFITEHTNFPDVTDQITEETKKDSTESEELRNSA